MTARQLPIPMSALPCRTPPSRNTGIIRKAGGRWNDVRVRFDDKDFPWCPRHANTPRQFECTRLITADQVITTLDKIV
jgi:autotransporter strand-loop-strand O-heptosyltransferase